jgi:hypothetical protein
MTFCHTFAGFRCTRCAETYEQHGGTSITAPHLIAALVFTVAFSFRLLREPWGLPWYSVFSIYAGELLLFFVSGFPLSLIGGLGRRRRCKKCKAPVLLAGRYFKYTESPWLEDYGLFAIHAVLNAVIWLNFEKLVMS